MERGDSGLSISRQCALLEIPRSWAYYTPNTSESAQNLLVMRAIDELYMRKPDFGSPRMTDELRAHGLMVNRKRVERLMRKMGLQAVLPGPHTSRPHPDHTIYPYLLRGIEVGAPDEVWCSDITYIPMRKGFMYLVAVMDWYSRYVLSWDVSNTMEASFCVDVLLQALRLGRPGIFNTDQGSQFTSDEFTGTLANAEVRISMDGRGRALDNAFIERLWRTVKYEDIYLREYADGHGLYDGLAVYFEYYNHERRHSSLGKQTPAQCYEQGKRERI